VTALDQVGRVGVYRHMRIGGRRCGRAPHADPYVNRDHPLVIGQQWVDVQFLDMGQFAYHLGYPQQDVFDRILVDLLHLPEGYQQLGYPGTVDQPLHQYPVERRQRHRAVMQYLGQGPTRPTGDNGAEHRVALDPHYQLPGIAGPRHRLHCDTLNLCLRFGALGRLHQRLEGGADIRGIEDIDFDPAHVGFVTDLGRTDLHGNRKTEGFSGHQGLDRRACLKRGGAADVEGAEKCLGFRIRKHIPPLGQG